MKWNVPKILLALLVVISCVQIVNAEIIFEDDFEQYVLGANPIEWTSAFGISSAVSADPASSGGQAFKLVGGSSWARGEYHTLSSLPDQVALEGAVYMTSDASTRRAELGFLQPWSNFLFTFNKVGFSGNEEIWWYGKENVKLGTWEAGKWYLVRVEIDFPQETADIYINGQQVATDVQAYPKEFDWYQSYNGVWHHIILGKWGLSTGNFAYDGSNNIIYLDDVKIETIEGGSQQSYEEWTFAHTYEGSVVKTTFDDPPPWKLNCQYPDWVWNCSKWDGVPYCSECIELTRILPINLVWKGTADLTVEDVINEFTEEGWEHKLLQYPDMYVYGGLEWERVYIGKTVASSFFRTGLDKNRYHVELFEVANGLVLGQAHQDSVPTILPWEMHEAIDCEGVEWRILDFFRQETDTEWNSIYNSYAHGNGFDYPYNNGDTTIIEYDFTKKNSNLYNGASVSCPVNLHAYVDGQHIGVNEEGLLDGIPDSVYNGPNSDPEEIVIYGEHSAISFEVRADPSDPEFQDPEARKFTLTTTQSTEEGLIKLLFVDVPVTANTIATVRNANYPVLVIDEDGDGEDDFTWNADMLINTYGEGEVNHAPIVEPIDDYEVIAGNDVIFTLTYQDEDEDPLTTAFTTTLPNGDEIAGLPEGATFDGVVFSWTPTPCQGGIYEIVFEVSDGGLKETATFTVEVIVPVAIDIDPDTLNLKSNGPYITTYIELPECYDPATIDALSCCLDCDHGHFEVLADAPCSVDDYDADGIPDMMVKFNREQLVTEFSVVDFETEGKFAEVSMTLTGTISDGARFVGEDIIQVRI